MNNKEVRHGRFVFFMDWPDEILPKVVEAAQSAEWLVPPWVHEVFVGWHPKETDGAADSEASYDYRRLNIRIKPAFLDENKASQCAMMRHEVLHASTNLPLIYAEEVIEKLLEGDDNKLFRKRVLADLRERHESAVTDLQFCIQEKLKTKATE